MGTKSDDLFGAETEPERYQLVQELASGGMATVFLARTRDATGATKLVAVKRIHRHLAREQSFLEMFFDEARIAARIRHPNICALFDFGRSGAVFYIAMEYVLGETLLELVRAAARDPRLRESLEWQVRAAAVVADACEGLHAVHELTDDDGQPMRVVHRDISPNNVFVTYDGGVKVVDFGIAFAQNKMHHTQTGIMKGKVGYMPPELIAGDGRDVDRRADVWALGVCLWEMLAGALLFRGHNDAATMLNVMQRPIPSLAHVAGVPAGLCDVVGRALERDRAARCPTARALGLELRAWIASTGVAVDAAEIAGFMRARFASQYTRKLGALELADSAAGAVDLGAIGDDLITRQLPLGSPSAASTDTAELMQLPASDEVLRSASSPGPGPARAASHPIPAPAPSPRGRRAALSVALAAAVLAVGGTGFVLWQERSGSPEAAALAVETPGPGVAEASTRPDEPAEPSSASPPSAEPTGSTERPAALPDAGAAEPPAEPDAAASESARDDEESARQEERADRSTRRRRARDRARDRARQRDRDEVRVAVREHPDAPEPADESPGPPPVTAPVAPPEPVKPEPPPVAPPRRTGPLAASVSIAALEVEGSLVNSMVSRAIERVMPSLKACYREAAVAAGKNARGAVRVKLSINEAGQVSGASAAGGPLPGLDACVRGVARKIRPLTRPDVGGATASFQVNYKPQGE